jgi:hypothetical protein
MNDSKACSRQSFLESTAKKALQTGQNVTNERTLLLPELMKQGVARHAEK